VKIRGALRCLLMALEWLKLALLHPAQRLSHARQAKLLLIMWQADMRHAQLYFLLREEVAQ